MLNADVVFLMDASTTDTLQNFESQKVLIKLLMKNLGALSENLRASLILYSTSAYVKSELKYYTTSQTFENEVEKATYLKGKSLLQKVMHQWKGSLSSLKDKNGESLVLFWRKYPSFWEFLFHFETITKKTSFKSYIIVQLLVQLKNEISFSV